MRSALYLCELLRKSYDSYDKTFNSNMFLGNPLLPEMALSKTKNWIVRLPQIAGYITSVTLPVAYGLQRWLDNCSPATFAYFVLPNCDFPSKDNGSPNFSLDSIVRLTFICTWTVWLLLDNIGFFCFVVFELSLLPGFCFQFYMKFFRKSLTASLTQSNLHGILKVNQRPFSRKSNYIMYREIQVLSRYYNLIQQDKIIIGILDIVLIAFIICFYALISNGSNVSIPHLFLFSSGLLNGFLGISVCFGTFGGVHGESLDTLAFLKSSIIPRVAPVEQKMLTKYVASLQPIKIRVGSVNYVDNMTPIVLLHFCFSQIVNLVMM